MERWSKSVLQFGVWGVLLPLISSNLVATLMLRSENLAEMTDLIKYILPLHLTSFGSLIPLLTKLHEVRDIEQLKQNTRKAMDDIITNFSRRLNQFAMVNLISLVICIATLTMKDNKEQFFYLIFLSGNTAFFSLCILFSSFLLLMSTHRLKTRILDQNREEKERDRTKAKRTALLAEFKKDRETGFKTVDALDRYNHVLTWSPDWRLIQ